jgi:hypothetical protein
MSGKYVLMFNRMWNSFLNSFRTPYIIEIIEKNSGHYIQTDT